MSDDKLNPPKQSTRDIAHSIAKAGISSIPVLGGPASELFQLIIQPPLEKRRIEWMTQVGEKLQNLESNSFNLNDLSENEEFVSAVMHASNIAIRTHQKEKVEALRNAILNVAIGNAPEESIQHLFINLIDSLTVLHIRILKLFQEPPSTDMSFGPLSHIIESNIPELRDNRELYQKIWRDLYNSGLVIMRERNLDVAMSGDDLSQKRTTGFGDDFLYFIAGSQ